MARGERMPKVSGVHGKQTALAGGNAEPRPWPVQERSPWPLAGLPMIGSNISGERHREDSGHGKMCADWVIVDKCEVLIAYCANCELMMD
ncbi:hypothetical protein IGI04_007079 [Brassica rapa subsp. trilocularis]|uniref:Uncharacterized protein n=1 Tax=Brassica rapa subsp. trilocularis TaxID=1813537 RepID=A0ABQ7NIU3_BRACM|nr:hypothetical protein IGI04_007079 [Brassica rapa subsp. trilocularis]